MLDSRAKSFPTTIVLVNSKATGFYKSYFENDRVRVLDIKEIGKSDLSAYSYISPSANLASPPEPSSP